MPTVSKDSYNNEDMTLSFSELYPDLYDLFKDYEYEFSDDGFIKNRNNKTHIENRAEKYVYFLCIKFGKNGMDNIDKSLIDRYEINKDIYELEYLCYYIQYLEEKIEKDTIDLEQKNRIESV